MRSLIQIAKVDRLRMQLPVLNICFFHQSGYTVRESINVSSGRDVYAAANKKHFHHGLKVDCLRFLQVPLDVNDIRGISCSAVKSATHLDVRRSNSPCVNMELSLRRGPLGWRGGTKWGLRDEYVRRPWQ